MTVERLSGLTPVEMAALVARDIPAGSYVNLGIGRPTAVGDHLPADSGIVLHTENGMLGMGPVAHGDEVDPDLINAGKVPVTALPGASYFDHAESFGMIRGGHIDVCVLGAYQVSATGDLANWHTGEDEAIPAVGGAMDLAVGARSVVVMMTLFDRHGRPKLVPRCTLPLTARGCVKRIYTEYATFVFDGDAFRVRDTYGCSLPELRARLGMDQLRHVRDGHLPGRPPREEVRSPAQ